MTPAVKGLLQRLDAIEWFSAVGRPLPPEQADAVAPIETWREAVECLISLQWGEYTHAQRDCLTVHVRRVAVAAFARWGEDAKELKSALNPILERQLAPLANVVGSYDELSLVRASVRFSLLGACQELLYAEAHPPQFFSSQVPWYLAGRLPCGWGERKPDGRLQLLEPWPEGMFDEFEADPSKPFYSEEPRLIEPAVRLPTFGRLLVY